MTCMTLRPIRNHVNAESDHLPEFGQLFGNMFDFPVRRMAATDKFQPAVDISETDQEINLTVELPGINKDQIKVTIKDHVLSIEGKREFPDKAEDGKRVHSELRSGSFARTFTLPETVDQEKITADCKDGLLYITLAKVEEVKPKEIEVSIK